MLNSNASTEASGSGSIGPKYTLIGSQDATYQENHCRERYLNEYTGERLPKHLIRAAIEELNSKVCRLSSIDEIMKVADHVFVTSR